MKKIFNYTLVLCSVCLILSWLPTQVSAEDGKFSTSFQFGERRTSDVITESIDYYSFYKYYSRLDAKVDPTFGYYLKYEFYDKDFDGKTNLDNQANTMAAGIKYLLKNSPENKLKLRLDLLQRNRNYKNSTSSEYDQTKAKLSISQKKDTFGIGTSIGMNYFDYNHADKDQMDTSFKLKTNKHLLSEKLKLKGFFGFTNSERDSSKDRYQLSEGLGMDLKFKQPLFKLLAFQIEAREADTKDLELEDRDDAYIFDELRWKVKTKHKLTDSISSSFKYEKRKRDYLDYNLNYSKYKIENSTRFQPINTQYESFYYTLGLGYKQEEFPDSDSKSKVQNSMKLSCTYNRKKSFKLGAKLGMSTDEYGASVSSNRNTYTAGLGFEKKFNEDVALELGWKLKRRDYKYTSDVQYQSFKVGVTYDW